jgi:gluconolactonase
MSFNHHLAVPFACVAFLACSSTPSDAPGSAGSGGVSTGGTGSAVSGTSPGGTTSGGATSGGAGAGGVGGGSAGSGGMAGAGGVAGGSGSNGGASGASGAGSAGGGGFWGPTGPKKQWSCPPGPFGAQTRSNQKNVCQGFAYNYNYNEGPTWIASQNAFFFSDFTERNGRTGDMIKFTPSTGMCEVFIKDAGCNGLAVHANGKIVGACHTSHSITEFDPVTKAKRVIVDTYNGRNLGAPNDVVVHSNGTIYFTNTLYESISTNPYPPAVFWVDPTGKINLLMDSGPNGIALSPDEKKLHVVGAGVWTLDDKGVPGARTGGGPGGDGISVDCAGGIHILGTNSAYGGPDGKTIFIVGRNGIFTAPSNIPGLP